MKFFAALECRGKEKVEEINQLLVLVKAIHHLMFSHLISFYGAFHFPLRADVS